MRKFLLILLAFAISFSVDCRDLMTSKTICHLTKSKADISKPKCHQEKETSSKDCDCAKTKNISIQDSAKNFKTTVHIEFIFDSPLNTIRGLDISSNVFFSFIPKILSPLIAIFLTKTIHLLI